MSSPLQQALARFALARPTLARVLPFAVYALFLALESVLGGDLRWLYAVRIAAVLAVLAYYWNDYHELHRFARPEWAQTILAVVVGILVLLVWIPLDHGWVTLGGAGKGFVPLAPDGVSLDWAMIAVRIGGAALVVPVMEELFWRSFVQRWIDQSAFLALDPRRGSTRALLICALAFGFEHGQWLAGILAGLAFGWLYRYTGRLWPAVLAHGVTNGLLGCWVIYTGQWHFW